MYPSFSSSATVLSRQPVPLVSLGDTSSATSRTTTHVCPFADCAKTYSRREDTERHILQHLPPCVYCSQPGCNWNGNRVYVLRGHFKTKHSDIPVPGKEEFMIYDAKALAKQLLNNEITTEQAASEAHSSFRRKAEQVGRLGLWRTKNFRVQAVHASNAAGAASARLAPSGQGSAPTVPQSPSVPMPLSPNHMHAVMLCDDDS